MKFSLNWLKEFVEINCSPEILIEKLILAGFEVEAVEKINEKLKQIVVGKIIKLEKHPNADRLQITTVFDGSCEHQIVTGATNVFEGAVVPVSLIGSVLTNGLEIKQTKLRGVDSFGMLCSEKELGLAEESQGIWLLPADTPLGTDLIDYYQLKDVILEIAILPNRGDCQSMFGLAREISVILNSTLKKPEFGLDFIPATVQSEVKVLAKDACPKYTARVIKNVVVKESPFWLKNRLTVSGIRPINNVVDITNYILLAFGQPLHAFDLNRLSEHKIIVRKAVKDEVMQTLDGKEHTLNVDDIVITDGTTPIALAGIMGGANTEILPETKDVLLEAAFFDPISTRKTAKRLGLRTESSIRFEKGIDFDQVEFASNYASFLIRELAEGQIEETFFSVLNEDYPLVKSKPIDFNAASINELLNSSFAAEEMISTLSKLGFEFNAAKNQILVPSWRKNDVQELPCLSEEIARILGYDRIPTTLPEHSIPVKAENKLTMKSAELKELLINYGFFEVKTFPMISELDQANLKEATDLKIKNPINQNESVMRTNLLPSLLKVFDFNYKRQVEDLRIFEIGKVFASANQVPLEFMHLGGLVMGKINPKAYEEKNKNTNEIDFIYLKNVVELILRKLDLDFYFKDDEIASYLHPKKSLKVYRHDVLIGQFGMLHPSFAKQYGFDFEIGYFDFDLSLIVDLALKVKRYQPFSKYPKMKRDLALLAPKDLNYKVIETKIVEFKPKLLKEFYLFDHFVSDKLGQDKYSLAFSFVYQNDDGNITDEALNKLHNSFVDRLKAALPIEVR